MKNKQWKSLSDKLLSLLDAGTHTNCEADEAGHLALACGCVQAFKASLWSWEKEEALKLAEEQACFECW